MSALRVAPARPSAAALRAAELELLVLDQAADAARDVDHGDGHAVRFSEMRDEPGEDAAVNLMPDPAPGPAEYAERAEAFEAWVRAPRTPFLPAYPFPIGLNYVNWSADTESSPKDRKNCPVCGSRPRGFILCVACCRSGPLCERVIALAARQQYGVTRCENPWTPTPRRPTLAERKWGHRPAPDLNP